MSRDQLPLKWLLAVVGCGALLGCGSEPTLRLEHLELLPDEEDTVEFPLGDFDVPIPESIAETDDSRVPRNFMQLEFSLYAEIVPAGQAQLSGIFSRHEGKIRDRVIQVFRNASVEELDEPNLLTVKSRLLEATEPILGLNMVRRMIIPSMQKYEL